MTQDEIIEMAQECNLIGMRPHLDGIYSEALIAFANLVAAKALAQPEQKPVGYVIVKDHGKVNILDFDFDLDVAEQLSEGKYPAYTTPPQRSESSGKPAAWVGLTDEEVRQMCGSVPSMREAVRETEAKLKEKNT